MGFPKITAYRWRMCVVVACTWLVAYLVMRPNLNPADIIIPALGNSSFLINTNLLRAFTPNKSCAVQVPLSPCACTRTLHRARCSDDSNNTDCRDQSTCGSWADLRGHGQKVVSYSLFGKFPGEYHKGLEILLEKVLTAYPGWTVRVYTDFSSSPEFIDWACNLACNYTHLDFCNASHLPGIGDVRKSVGLVWRFAVVGDPLVDRYMSRDLDAPIIQREVDAVDEWIESGKCYHVMRDNPFHGVPMLAGMWGGCNSWNRHKVLRIRDAMLRAATSKFSDQPVLWRFLWPLVQHNVTMHDSYNCGTYRGSLPFPTQRHNRTFVGMRTYRKGFEQDAVWPKCPEKCRPPQHKDWELC